MVRITFVDPAQVSHTVEIKSGDPLMQSAIANGVDGIYGECGGNAMCATCHVYVEESRLADLPPMSDYENELLAGTAAERKPNSRLSCQIKASDDLDGLTVFVAPAQ